MAARLGTKFKRARLFYGIIIVSIAAGVLLNFAHINPIKALFWSAVINGVVAVPVMAVMMWLAAAPKVMGEFVVTGWAKVLGWIATGVMLVAIVAMLTMS